MLKVIGDGTVARDVQKVLLLWYAEIRIARRPDISRCDGLCLDVLFGSDKGC